MSTPAAPGKGQGIVHIIELVSSLLTLGAAAGITVIFGMFSRALPFCGLGIFTGLTGLIASAMFMVKGPKIHGFMRGLVELVISTAWAAFFVATGVLAAQLLGMGACVGTGSAAGAAAAAAADTAAAAADDIAQAAADALAAAQAAIADMDLGDLGLGGGGATRRLLQDGGASDGFSLDSFTGAISGAMNEVASFVGIGFMLSGGGSPAICGAGAALTAGGFMGFAAFTAGAVLAVLRDLKQGHGVWAPASARAKQAPIQA